MKVYAAVARGIKAPEDKCDDRILVGDRVIEDGYIELTLDEKDTVLAVADGVGGSPCGYVAAQMALEELAKLHQSGEMRPEAIAKRVEQVNELVLRAGQENMQYAGMATTLSLLRFFDGKATCLHVGDTRVYQKKNVQGMKVFSQLTTDQNQMQMWLESGEAEDRGLTEEDLKHIRGWASIISWMGMEPFAFSERLKIKSEIVPQGMFVLTSDGIHDYIDKNEMRKILEEDISYEDKIARLMERARENGSRDDQSIIVACLGQEE